MPPRDLKKVFSDLMQRGINITRAAQEGDAIYAGIDQLHDAFRDYQIWRIDIKDFLADAKVNTLDWYKFYESDSVPLLKGGIEYSDIQSEKSQTLLRNIRIETSKKLDLLKDLGQSLFGKAAMKAQVEDPDVISINGKKNKFSFNIATGNTSLNAKRVNFPPGQQKFNFLKTLAAAKENLSRYENICKALNLKDSKPSRRSIQSLLKEIKQDLEILPSGKKSNPDIFCNVPRTGYQLIVQ